MIADTSPTEAGVRPLEFVNILLRRWRLTLGLPIVLAVLSAGLALVIPPTFTATTTFVPENEAASQIPAGLAGLAGQFGISIGGGSSQSPQFYVALVKSRSIMQHVLLSRYDDPRLNTLPGDSTTLLELLELDAEDPGERVSKGLQRLQRLLTVNSDPQTNIVNIDVKSPYPNIAAEVANRFVALIHEFNTTTRQSQAHAQRIFTDERVAAAEEELRQAEGHLRTFLERNRRWQQSPELVFEQGWLQRRVTIAQEVYLSLRREHESVRIQEVNDTPVITVVDRAVPPEQRSSPRRTLMVILAFTFGTILAAFSAVVLEFLQRLERRGDKDYMELRELLGRLRRRKRGAI